MDGNDLIKKAQSISRHWEVGKSAQRARVSVDTVRTAPLVTLQEFKDLNAASRVLSNIEDRLRQEALSLERDLEQYKSRVLAPGPGCPPCPYEARGL